MFEKGDAARSINDNIRDFGEHLFHSVMQAPRGLYQVANKLTADSLPEWKAEKLPVDSRGALMGELTGSAALFIGSSLLARAGAKRFGLLGNSEMSLVRQTTLSALETGAAGSMLGLAQPVNDRDRFWAEKLQVSSQMGLSFGVMGAANRALSLSGYFGVAGERSIHQSIALNGLSGAGAGAFDAFAKAGITEGRWASRAEVLNSSLNYGVFGGLVGSFEYAAPHVMQAAKTLCSNLKASESLAFGFRLDPNLARLTGDPIQNLKLSEKATLPLPAFDKMAKVTVAAAAPVSEEALKQSLKYIERGSLAEPLQDGVRIATSVRSKGLDPKGLPLQSSERFIVVDRANDPVLRAVTEDAKVRFQGITDPHELATEINGYVGKLFNRYNLKPEQLDDLYGEMLRRNNGALMPIGEFIRSGSAVCLPRATLVKAIADDLSLSLRLREGLMGITKPQPHAWVDRLVSSGEFKIYDPSHAPNPQFRYMTPKDH
ncbi:MAG: hypothetical protein K2X27_08130 [Candidatus Obscuribacterales bacterium]|nr:hypothetical protein [Candidatus Obscuribacterales bacterium]